MPRRAVEFTSEEGIGVWVLGVGRGDSFALVVEIFEEAKRVRCLTSRSHVSSTASWQKRALAPVFS